MAVQQPAPAPVPAPIERVSVTEQPSYNFRLAAVVGFIVAVVDIFIAARFLGKLFGASAQSAFVNCFLQFGAAELAGAGEERKGGEKKCAEAHGGSFQID